MILILSVKERLILQGILPSQGNIITLKIIQDVRNELSFGEEEIALLKLETTDDGRMTWDQLMEPECSKEISIGPVLFKLIQTELDKLDSESKLPIDAISLWDKFEKADLVVIEKPPEEVVELPLDDECPKEIIGPPFGEDRKPE